MRRAWPILLACVACLACGDDEATSSSGGEGGVGGMGGAGGTAGGGAVAAITFIDDHNVDTGAMFGGTEVGGLSALHYVAADNKLLALSDDRASLGPVRFYELDVTLDTALSVSVTAMVEILGPSGPYGPGEVDAEGLAPVGGDLIYSTEGDGLADPRVPPALRIMSRAGAHLQEVTVPADFVPNPTGLLNTGVRNNAAFEALTVAPSGAFMFVANEGALVQDGALASTAAGTVVRIQIYDTASLTPTSHVLYRTDPVPDPGGNVTSESLGVSEMLALDDSTLLVMERAAVAVDGVFSNRIRIYRVDLTTGDATTEVAKTLLIDFDDILPQLDPAYPTLDNFEGMTFGPDIDGLRTLLVVSDNNFGFDQRTAFFAFQLGP